MILQLLYTVCFGILCFSISLDTVPNLMSAMTITRILRMYCCYSGPESPSHICCQNRRVALRRQARLEATPDQLQDPWVRLSDSPENQPSPSLSPSPTHTSINMADNAEVEVTEKADANGVTEPQNTTDMQEQSPSGKKGPPVAPKPTWFRKSLKKNGQLPPEQLKPTENKSPSVSRTFGVNLRSTPSNSSIKQRIHSFETFSSTEGSDRGSRRVAATTSASSTERTTRPTGTSVSSDASTTGRSSTTLNNNTVETEETQPSTATPEVPATVTTEVAPEKPSEEPSKDTDASKEPSKDTDVSEDPSKDTEVSKDPLKDTEPEVGETTLDEEPTEEPSSSPADEAATSEEAQEEAASPAESTTPTHCPRRASSSKAALSDKPPASEGDAVHQASLRTRSLPLSASSESSCIKGLDGESLGKILSFSNQVSHALMRSMQSLPQSPCVRQGNPWPSHASLNPGAEDQDNTTTDKVPPSPAADSNERGFSVRYA